MTQEPEMIKAFRDTWELGIHSYLTYLRDRLLLSRDLLNESGSIFVQISDENLHHVREIMDETFGSGNFVSLISYATTSGFSTNTLSRAGDYIIWYSKDFSRLKYRQLYKEKNVGEEGATKYREVSRIGSIPIGIFDPNKLASTDSVTSQGENKDGGQEFEFNGITFNSPSGQHWKATKQGMERLGKSGRLVVEGKLPRYIRFIDDFSVFPINNLWRDVGGVQSRTDGKIYVVQTAISAIERCMQMASDPGDLVLDPTCGSGTTALVAEKWGRRWITCDTSRVAITLAKQRLMTASYDYFDLKYPHEGLRGAFIYKTIPYVTLGTIANNPEIDGIYDKFHPVIEQELARLNKKLQAASAPEFTPTEGARKGQKLNLARESLMVWEVPFNWPNEWPEDAIHAFEDFHKARIRMQQKMDESIAAHASQETLYDQPSISKNKLRITGPFTVEAVPFPSVKSLDEASGPQEADASIARTGESGRQHQWRDELLKTGIRGKGGQMLKFADLEALPSDLSIRNLHATGHLDSGERVVVSFGPEHAALEQRQVTNALNEAGNLFPLPKMIVFCAFTFDPEAAKDIDALKGITALKAQMNTDLLTEDLKKAKSSNQSFWLMGQPEVEIRHRKDGKYEVEVHGFDYFDTVKGELISGGKSKIAMWSLDTDYDERSLFPKQVFFPMAGKGEGWEKLKKNIRAELDESKLDKFHGTVSLPFEAGDNRKVAIKIVDDRGIESLKVLSLD